MFSMTKYRNTVLLLLLLGTGFAVAMLLGLGDSLVDASGSRSATLEVANSDDEWLQLIEEARIRRATTDVVFADARLGDDIVQVDTCSDIPAGAVPDEQLVDLSTNETAHRVIVIYTDLESRTRYALILRSDRDYPDCGEEEQLIAKQRPGVFEAVDEHVCAEMTRMAAGDQPSDPTLRPASPAVAEAFLAAFCDSPAR